MFFLCLVKWFQNVPYPDMFCTVWRTCIHQGYHLVNFNYVTEHLQSQTINNCAIHCVASDSCNICQTVVYESHHVLMVGLALGMWDQDQIQQLDTSTGRGLFVSYIGTETVIFFRCCHCTWLLSTEMWHFLVL